MLRDQWGAVLPDQYQNEHWREHLVMVDGAALVDEQNQPLEKHAAVTPTLQRELRSWERLQAQYEANAARYEGLAKHAREAAAEAAKAVAATRRAMHALGITPAPAKTDVL